MTSQTNFPSFGLTRRHWLGGALAVSALTVAPWGRAASSTQAEQASNFMALSQYLTERSELSSRLATRLLAALEAQHAGLGEQISVLWQWISTNQVALANLNTRLKAERPELAGLPGDVMQAWYLGIVGTGLQAKAVTYEFALNAQTVSDKLRPPSYAYGVYGSWASNPNTFNLQRIAMPA